MAGGGGGGERRGERGAPGEMKREEVWAQGERARGKRSKAKQRVMISIGVETRADLMAFVGSGPASSNGCGACCAAADMMAQPQETY